MWRELVSELDKLGSSLREERFILAHDFRSTQFIMAGNHSQRNIGGWSDGIHSREQREMQALSPHLAVPSLDPLTRILTPSSSFTNLAQLR